MSSRTTYHLGVNLNILSLCVNFLTRESAFLHPSLMFISGCRQHCTVQILIPKADKPSLKKKQKKVAKRKYLKSYQTQGNYIFVSLIQYRHKINDRN